MTKRFRLLVAASALVTALTAVPAVASVSAQGCASRVNAAAVNAATPLGATACPGARPGALVEIPKAASGDLFCTMGFVYRDKKYSYITTAGHCVIKGVDTVNPGPDAVKVWGPGKGPVALDSNGKKIGNYVFAAEQAKTNIDFGLIMLSVKPNPQMCHFGGPTGMSSSTASGPAQLEWYGNANVFGSVVPARTGLALSLVRKDQIYALGPSLTGDSGAPVILASNGQALGHIVAVGVGEDPGAPTAGNFFIDRMGPSISLAQHWLGRSLVLQTAKTL